MRRIVNRLEVATPTELVLGAECGGVLMHKVSDLCVSGCAAIHVHFTLEHATVDGKSEVVHAGSRFGIGYPWSRRSAPLGVQCSLLIP